jgi:hypothetical protein
VAEGLKTLVRDLDGLIPLPGNPRHGDVDAIVESLRRFGQLKPIVINADGVILAGNHTYLAAVELGWTQIAALVVDLEGDDQPAFALADNRLSDLASYDNTDLLAMLAEVSDLTGVGYDSDDIETLERLSATYGEDAPLDPYGMWEGMPGYESANRQAAFTCTFHFLTMEDADEFFGIIDRPKRRVNFYPNEDGFKGSDVTSQAWMGE